MDPALIVELVILVIKILMLVFGGNQDRVLRVLQRRNIRHPLVESIIANPYILGRSLSSSQRGSLSEVLSRLTKEDIVAIQNGTFGVSQMQGIHPANASENAKRILESFMMLTDEQIDQMHPPVVDATEGGYEAGPAKTPPNKDQVKAISFAASLTISSIATATGNARFIAFSQFISAISMNPELFDQVWNIAFPTAPVVPTV